MSGSITEKPAELDSGHLPVEPATHDLPVTRIRPRPGWRWINVGELWRYRELLLSLVGRDIKVRYKQSVLGALWAILEPLLLMVVFTIVFGRMAKVSSGGIPYPIFVYSGILLWSFFARSITSASASMVQSQALLTKVYFPRLAVPFSSIGAAAVDFCIAFIVLLLLMVYYEVAVTVQVLWVPLLLLLAGLAALGVGTLLSALNVAYRDFKHTVPLLVQFWMLATPSIYMEMPANSAATPPAQTSAQAAAQEETPAHESSHSTTAEQEDDWLNTAARLLRLNPMAALIASFRAAMLGSAIPFAGLGYSAVFITLLFLGGCFYFRRVERTFADII